MASSDSFSKPLIEYLRYCNNQLAFLTEYVLPQVSEAVKLPDNNLNRLYTLNYNLYEDVLELGVAPAFSKHMAALAQSYTVFYGLFGDLFSGIEKAKVENAEVVVPLLTRIFSSSEASVAKGLDLLALLQIPTHQPFVWHNAIGSLSRRTSDASLTSLASQISSQICDVCVAWSAAVGVDEPAGSRPPPVLPVERGPLFPSLLRPSKRGFVPLAGRKLLGQSDVGISYPTRTGVTEATLYVYPDTVVITARDKSRVMHSFDTRTLVVSSKRERWVGANVIHFSLFANLSKGKVLHLGIVTSTPQQKATCMQRLHAAMVARVNLADQPKPLAMLVRERRPGRGRSTEHGAEWHFAIWAVGWRALWRYDADSGRALEKFGWRELEQMAAVEESADDGERRTLIKTRDGGSYELSGYGVAALAQLTRGVWQWREEREVTMKARRTQQEKLEQWMSGGRKEREEQLEQARQAGQADAKKKLEERLEGKMQRIMEEYEELSHNLYQRELEVRNLKSKMAEKNAPTLQELKEKMTVLEKKEFKGKEELEDDDSLSFSRD